MRRIFGRIFAVSAATLAVVLLVGWALYAGAELPGEERLATGTSRNVALYVPMPDGVRLAVDIWYPPDLQPGERRPTLMRSTRYWRAQDRGPLVRAAVAFGRTEASDLMSPEIQAFNEAGYVVALADVRGSGASFGSRDVEMGPAEAEDLGVLARWIADQPWSNGRVGTWGVSYEGNTAAMAAATGAPAVVAAAPQFADYDAWRQLLWPGGVFARGFIQDWGELVQALDYGDICVLAAADTESRCRLVRLATRGVKRVDGPHGEALYQQARLDHATPDPAAVAAEAEFRDAAFGPGGLTLPGVSIMAYQPPIEEAGVPLFSWAGWMDAATVDGALQLFATSASPVRTVIGPWSHGGGHHTDPFLPDDAPVEPSVTEQRRLLLDFFDHHVRDGSTEAGPGSGQIRYWTFNDGWHTTDRWPPEGVEARRLYFGPGGTLSAEEPGASSPGEAAADVYKVDFSHSTGYRTRWHTQLGGGDVIYGDRAEADRQLLTYTSAPLPAPLEITGAVEVDLHVASTQSDGAFFAYLEVVDPSGVVQYITEGQIRAVHRRPCESSDEGPLPGPCHTFRREDAAPLVPGEPARIRFAMINTSVLVPAGHRIRIALAGHDASVFDRYPAEGVPEWTVYRSPRRPSGVVLPVRSR